MTVLMALSEETASVLKINLLVRKSHKEYANTHMQCTAFQTSWFPFLLPLQLAQRRDSLTI